MINAQANQQPDPIESRHVRIRTLNDRLRQTGEGGRIVLTEGIAALPATVMADVIASVATFDGFGPDNDPWGEHDCATLEVETHRIIWKIDYYDRDLLYGSQDPANPAVTTRVLTIMLAEEY